MHAETLPPFRRISSRPISSADASRILDKYLNDSERHAHLHPDSIITAGGVIFGENGPTGGVIMRSLRRVAAGLRGEYLGPEITEELEGAEEQDAQTGGTKGADTTAGAAETGWQSMSEFEREEAAIEIGEIGDRTNFVQEGEGPPEVEVHGGASANKRKGTKDEFEGMDKAARKKAKKQRDKEFKKQKENARAGKTADHPIPVEESEGAPAVKVTGGARMGSADGESNSDSAGKAARSKAKKQKETDRRKDKKKPKVKSH